MNLFIRLLGLLLCGLCVESVKTLGKVQARRIKMWFHYVCITMFPTQMPLEGIWDGEKQKAKKKMNSSNDVSREGSKKGPLRKRAHVLLPSSRKFRIFRLLAVLNSWVTPWHTIKKINMHNNRQRFPPNPNISKWSCYKVWNGKKGRKVNKTCDKVWQPSLCTRDGKA